LQYAYIIKDGCILEEDTFSIVKLRNVLNNIVSIGDGLVSALYILSRGGIALYYRNLGITEKQKDDEVYLFSSILSAIQDFLRESNIGEPSKFDTTENEIRIRSEPNFVIVLVTAITSTVAIEDRDRLLAEIVAAIMVDFDDNDFDGSGIDPDLREKLDGVVSHVYEIWFDSIQQSKATRKLKDSLW